MKTLMAKPLIWAAVASLLLCPSAFAKKKPLNLSAFAGNYTGTVTLVSPGDSARGTATVVITVPKNGKSATLLYTATIVSSMGDTSILPTEMTLAANKTISVTDLGVGIAGTNNAHPGTGTWSQRKRALSFSATNGDIVLTGTASAKNARKKRKLTLTLVSSDAGGSNTFTTTLTAKLPKPKK
jgi:uncharacterized lipoprotein NlpE involved in copper resistance